MCGMKTLRGEVFRRGKPGGLVKFKKLVKEKEGKNSCDCSEKRVHLRKFSKNSDRSMETCIFINERVRPTFGGKDIWKSI